MAGSYSLREKSKERKPIMQKHKKSDNIGASTKYIKQLEDKLLKLRIGNTY